MGLLQCQLFQEPPEVHDRLERCLLNDADHITPGSIGDHVKKIQIALNQLSVGPGRDNLELIEDGVYGPLTAAAVKQYKNAPSRRILQPSQTSADDIVGKRTIKSLDDEMDILENEVPTQADPFISTTLGGPAHAHNACPTFRNNGQQQLVEHFGTPINPQGVGPFTAFFSARQLRPRRINLGGEGETKYLGFEDFLPNPFSQGPPRPLTRTLPDHCATDICLRDAPILKDASPEKGKQEILRIAVPGCRLTFCGDLPQFRGILLTMGQIIHRIVVPDPRFSPGSLAEILVLVLR
jgi:hypothetical protein